MRGFFGAHPKVWIGFLLGGILLLGFILVPGDLGYSLGYLIGNALVVAVPAFVVYGLVKVATSRRGTRER